MYPSALEPRQAQVGLVCAEMTLRGRREKNILRKTGWKISNKHNNTMKGTLKVYNPRVIILLICINDVQGKELSF